ncbi:MAG: HEPN domain-containing protein [Candidatus Wallbacteria bacterium]|nr:HEPN domain-containing protein [Candidatus Wallbacteria bacterium]
MSEKIVKNWIELADYDLETAGHMLRTGRYLYVAFTCQQAIEKLLKANYAAKLEKTPPYTHNLIRLLEETGLSSQFDEKSVNFLMRLNSYYIETRYAEQISELSALLTEQVCSEIYNRTLEIFSCLKKMIR